MAYRVAFLGFSDFERSALASYFRLAADRVPGYETTPSLNDADYLVADADHAPSVQLVSMTDRLTDTVFIGARAPAGCQAWMSRPIDALHVMRELDSIAVLARKGVVPSAHATEPRPDDLWHPSGAGTTLSLDLGEPAPIEAPLAARPEVAPRASSALLSAPVLAETLIERSFAPTGPAALAAAVPVSPTLPPPPPPPPAPPPPPTSSAPPAAKPQLALPTPLALLVDDSDVALRFLASRLEPWGMQMHMATGSAQALELVAQHNYQYIFLDVELGSESAQDGLELCQQIRHSGSALDATVVMVSAHQTQLDRARGTLAGCDAYLGKPLDDAELRRLLHRHGLRLPGEARKIKAPA